MITKTGTAKQDRAYDRLTAAMKNNIAPEHFTVTYETADGCYRVVHAENGLYYAQESNGCWWNFMRKGNMLFRAWKREPGAVTFVESKATPAEML